MAGKRQATSDLNHQNWDQEDDPEERGTFRTASQDELKSRVIKKARRKAVGVIPKDSADAEDASVENKSVFSGFAGFNKPAAVGTGSPFEFLAKLPVATTNEATKSTFSFISSSNASPSMNDSKVTPAPMFSFEPKKPEESKNLTESNSKAPSVFGTESVAKASESESISSSKSLAPIFKSADSTEKSITENSEKTEYCEKVADLNFAVIDFLKEHMDKNPYCILTPVFEDYKKHLMALQKDKNDPQKSNVNISKEPTAIIPTATTISFGKPTTTMQTTDSPLAASFGKKPNSSVTSETATTTSTTPFFSFGSTQVSPVSANSNAASKVTSTAGIFIFGAKPVGETVCGDAVKVTGSSPPAFSPGKKPNCTVTSGTAITTPTTPLFSFGNTQVSTATTTSRTPLFSFGNAQVSTATTTSNAITTPKTPLFSFGNTQVSTAKTTSNAASTVTSTATTASTFSFGIKTTSETADADVAKPGFFSFGAKNDTAKTDPVSSPLKTNGFNFGVKSDDKASTSSFMFSKPAIAEKETKPSGFSFTPYSFGDVQPSSTSADPAAKNNSSESATAEDEDESPPKAEFKQVVEEDATYSKRCKVFVKKNNDFVDRGVGTLYLKPVKDSEKTQMLVRADTNLGNILVNLILGEGMPCQRMGKNNVMIVCVPTPDEEKSIPILLRVKSGEEADELLERIEKLKK